MAALIAEHAPSGATVVSLQNGVGNVDVLLTRLGGMGRVVAGMVPFNVVQTHAEGSAPRFHRATSGTLLIASGVADLRQALNVAGAPVAEHADMAGVLWGKLLLNLNNALNALCGVPLATQLADRRWRLVLAAQIAEALTVLKAAGIRPARIEGVPPGAIPAILRLPDWLFRRVARRMLAIDPEARSSMWEDLVRRRTTEIDFLQGAILALAGKTGVRVPLSEHIVRLVKEAEAARAGSPELRPEQVGRIRR
jgi:2-dehydropantoate 2-reductase